jgi:leucyl aminopeptidase (aminopeptidase T)
MLGRMVTCIARRNFTGNKITFHTFTATGSHGAEPDAATARRMLNADVILYLTTYSLSHTNARTEATARGARVASMPQFETSMLAPDGPLAVDAGQVAGDVKRFAGCLSNATQAIVRTAYGTDLRFSLEGREGRIDDGLFLTPGLFGNLPAGEAYAAPLEGTGEGWLVVPAGWYPGLKEEMRLRFEKGVVIELLGGGHVGDNFRDLLRLDSCDLQYLSRRNLAELGIGCNPNARRPDNVLEAEKIKGTVHIAIGDSAHIGGQVNSDSHEDFVQPQPDLILDGKPFILNGEWQ